MKGQRAEDERTKQLGMRGDRGSIENLKLTTPPPTRDADRRARNPAAPLGHRSSPTVRSAAAPPRLMQHEADG